MVELKFALALLFYPRQAFVALKIERSRTGYLGDIAMLVSVVLVRIAFIYTTHFPLAALKPRDSNLLLEVVRMVIPLLTWVVANSAVTSIFGGEVMPRQTLKASVFAMLPYVVLTIPLALVSRALGAGEEAFFVALQTLILTWVGGLLFYAVMVLNDYTIVKTIWICVLSIIGMLLLWAVLLLAYALTGQLYSFISRFALELKMLYLER
ncbi:MAG: hypothetical protein HN368_07215 [Spirochaetales bacterium]|jgi:hypothetical protein|nr:hypothetical protein [Spirochaetales bacterium]